MPPTAVGNSERGGNISLKLLLAFLALAAVDDIAIVPSRRTRDPEEVSTVWQIDAYKFGLPMLAAPMDSVVSPDTAIEIGRLGN